MENLELENKCMKYLLFCDRINWEYFQGHILIFVSLKIKVIKLTMFLELVIDLVFQVRGFYNISHVQ